MTDGGRRTKFAISTCTARSSSPVEEGDESDLGDALPPGHEVIAVLAANDEIKIAFAIAQDDPRRLASHAR